MTDSLDLQVTLFNRYKQLVDSSRNAVCRHIQYLLKPGAYPNGTDAQLITLLQIWEADKRAMGAGLNIGASKDSWVMPPDDEEHRLCRKMAAIQIEGRLYGEASAEHYLDSIIEDILNSTLWRDMANHPPSCACQKFDMWTYGNAKKVEVLKDYYDRIVNGCRGGADGPPPERKRV